MADKVYEIHTDTALQISAEIGAEFRKGNDDYAAIQKTIEEKYGEGALILSLRTMVLQYNRLQQRQHR